MSKSQQEGIRVELVRFAELDDLDVLHDIEEDADQLFAHAFGTVPWPDPPTGLVRSAQPGFILVAGRPAVGFAHLLGLDGHAHLEQLSVRRAHQRSGLGGLLLEATAQEARGRGYDQLTLCTFDGLAWNAPFYRRHAFIEATADDVATMPYLAALRAAESAQRLHLYGRRIVMVRQLTISRPGWPVEVSEVDPAAEPSPVDLATLLARLVGSDWPTSELERIAWSKQHGLPDSGRAEESVGTWTGESFHATETPDQPAGTFGWHTFHDEFVGVHWFLWQGLPRDVVRSRAVELKLRLREQFGSPADETPEDPLTRLGFTSSWSAHGRTIDLYFHTGIHHLHHGQTVDGPAVVQLHLDHTQRSTAMDAEARERQRQRDPRPSS